MPGTIIQQSLTAEQTQRRLGGGIDLRLKHDGFNWLTDLAVQHQRATFADSAPEFSAPYDDSLAALTLTAQSGVELSRGSWSFAGGADLRQLRPRGSVLNDSTPRSQTFGGVYASAALRTAWARSGFVQLSVAARGDAGSGVGHAVLSPKAVVSAGRGGWSVSASWSESFSPPTLGDLFFQEGVQVKANPDLRPERVRNELSLSVALREQPVLGTAIRASVLGYRADIDDMILWTPNFAYVWSPHNFDINRRGIEGEVADRITAIRSEVGLDAAYSDLTYAGPVFQGQVIYRPHWTGAARFDLDAAGFRAGLTARYVGSRRTGIGSVLNLLPAFTIADFHLSRRFRLGRSSLELSAGVDNLFDQRTTLLVDYPSPGRGWWVGTRIGLGREDQAPVSQ
jgi:iron complex outermembrane receptor protein